MQAARPVDDTAEDFKKLVHAVQFELCLVHNGAEERIDAGTDVRSKRH